MKRASAWSLVSVFCLAVAGCGGSTRGAALVDGGAGRDGGSPDGGGQSGGSGTPGSGGQSAVGGNVGSGGGTVAGGSTGSGGNSGTAGGTGVGGSVTAGTAQCSDGLDNDGDHLVDLADPDCVSPLDNDESSLSTGIPGDNMDACKQDCFFDGNSGMGDDGCDWNLKCDPANTNPGQCMYDANFRNCTAQQSQRCVTACRKLTPNGCDCFGCCVVPGASTPVRLVSTCTSADFGDPTKCPACTQSTSCNNDCGHCELCLGKTSLPPDCGGGAGGAGGTNDGGTPPPPECGDYVPCGPTGLDPSACPSGAICITGCCIPT